jgi:hypothetical protein
MRPPRRLKGTPRAQMVLRDAQKEEEAATRRFSRWRHEPEQRELQVLSRAR